jgi:hypothetical protein
VNKCVGTVADSVAECNEQRREHWSETGLSFLGDGVEKAERVWIGGAGRFLGATTQVGGRAAIDAPFDWNRVPML